MEGDQHNRPLFILSVSFTISSWDGFLDAVIWGWNICNIPFFPGKHIGAHMIHNGFLLASRFISRFTRSKLVLLFFFVVMGFWGSWSIFDFFVTLVV